MHRLVVTSQKNSSKENILRPCNLFQHPNTGFSKVQSLNTIQQDPGISTSAQKELIFNQARKYKGNVNSFLKTANKFQSKANPY